jgi:hypothetical protein
VVKEAVQVVQRCGKVAVVQGAAAAGKGAGAGAAAARGSISSQ